MERNLGVEHAAKKDTSNFIIIQYLENAHLITSPSPHLLHDAYQSRSMDASTEATHGSLGSAISYSWAR